MNANIRLEDTVIALETYGGDRVVHFYGYGYCAEQDNGKGEYRFLEYCGYEVPLDEVLSMGFIEAEQSQMDSVKEYIRDCTEDECMDIYAHYDNGNEPTFIKESEIDMNTPDGVYIVRYGE